MYNGREIGELRADVAVNCRTLIERAAARGLPVLVVQTVRDAEYQRYLVSMGYAAGTATVPTFHAKGVGLAFDICKNVKGHEYDDPGFFTAMGRLGKEMGFTWGGDWRSFPDRPHFQWDGGGKYTSSMVRAGRYPPPMPRFEEEETMTQEQFNTLMEGYWRSLAQREPADWSAEAREWSQKKKRTDRGRRKRQQAVPLVRHARAADGVSQALAGAGEMRKGGGKPRRLASSLFFPF